MINYIYSESNKKINLFDEDGECLSFDSRNPSFIEILKLAKKPNATLEDFKEFQSELLDIKAKIDGNNYIRFVRNEFGSGIYLNKERIFDLPNELYKYCLKFKNDSEIVINYAKKIYSLTNSSKTSMDNYTFTQGDDSPRHLYYNDDGSVFAFGGSSYIKGYTKCSKQYAGIISEERLELKDYIDFMNKFWKKSLNFEQNDSLTSMSLVFPIQQKWLNDLKAFVITKYPNMENENLIGSIEYMTSPIGLLVYLETLNNCKYEY